MDLLKKIFPLSFKSMKEVKELVIAVVIYVVAGIVGGVLLGVAGLLPLPFLGILLRIVGTALDLYVVGGIVLVFLKYFKVIKD